ncbi:HAMP domain-containing sensor histidine kinase [Tenacibaculum sp. 1_MG-2023]|uniref:sensor histidine kinase n=1 Tax=Tenacibaculum sp. 1_MG-2023 TaxID=3062653 RepID=UPI0026E2DE1A|nr:HAMP domain-containing sensor histidine kinase [Tenacibaculum sp. 1_MG-2023]MDO6676265.1 HAMP domain-containing sensor histidine kinase [Tenacibaculum sp. 1_MG-2023]
MNTKKHRWVLYLISLTIIVTILIQFYWNYKNYQQNKQRVINEIQLSLDNAVEEYYAALTKQNFFAIVESGKTTSKSNLSNKNIWKEVFSSQVDKKKDSIEFEISSFDIKTDDPKEFKKMNSYFVDSLLLDIENKIKDSTPEKYSKITQVTQFNKPHTSGIHIDSSGIKEVKVFKGKKATDSLKLIKGLQTIFISVQNDALNHGKLDSIIKKQLTTKGISTPFYLNHFKHDTLFYSSKKEGVSIQFLQSDAKSTYVKSDEKLTLLYENPSSEILKRSSTGIILSLLLSLAVVMSLFYLLKIINQQKELAEIKNDLISNITHEFKTPITTVSTALEAINNFNAIDDKEKTKKYISISSVQIEKLHLMVEKLLETATLDSEKLLLKKEPVNLVELIENNTKKHQFTNSEKTIQFSSNKHEIVTDIDVFHFENAISNLLDNAIKYGGNKIEVHINQVLNAIEITIADNGKGIDKNQQEKIFDQFYRIPKGNTHDVKGFGIGLYYTKKIIEKHKGVISLISKPNNTLFKIVLNNE